MIIDYHKIEHQIEKELLLHIGIQFEDEPDELYVVLIHMDSDAQVMDWQLMYNGYDCNYSFKSEEKKQLIDYLEKSGLEFKQN